MPLSLSRIFYIPLNPNRIYGLDILRAFAILSVLLSHSTPFLPAVCWSFNDLLTFDGVSIFFVLSGFLIGTILIKTLDVQEASRRVLLDFWIKRWFRTVPPYFLALIIVVFFTWHNYDGIRPDYYKRYFVFLQNFKSPHPIYFGEAWSLSVEEWFYLLVPSAAFLLVNLRIKSKASVVTVALTVLIIVTGYRYYKYLHFPPHDLNTWDLGFRKVVVTRLDSLMYGVISAYLSYYAREHWMKNRGLKFILGALVLCVGKLIPLTADGYGLYSSVFSFSGVSIGVMLTLPYLSSLKAGSGWVYRALTRISLISYSMYLLNLTIVQGIFVRPLLQWMGVKGNLYLLIGYAAFWVFTISLSVLMYKYFEVPFMQLRNNFTAVKKQSISTTSKIV